MGIPFFERSGILDSDRKNGRELKMNTLRALNKDGSDNIDRSEIKFSWKDSYHRLLAMRWAPFFSFTVALYLIINLLFSLIYFLQGPDGLNGIIQASGLGFFEECFFFSIQTFSTIGYGRVSPVGFGHNLTVAIEAFLGMLSISVMSGILFARFSRPTSKIKFSEVALLTQHRGKKSFIFRMANTRLNQIVEASLSVSILLNHRDENGSMRVQSDLNLVRSKSLIFAASWTAAHIVDESSPLYGKTLKDLSDLDAEIIVSIIGLDNTFSQTIHARYSYTADDIVENKQFVDILNRNEGRYKIDLAHISDIR